MNSCRWSAVTITALLLALPLFTAFAAERLDWGAQLHSGPQACPNGRVIVNAVQKVVNSVDSGTTRAVWAFDDYVRQIQVVDTGSGFCATVKYQGSFTSIAGDSPGAGYNTGGTIGDGVVGTFEGGYISTLFTGLLKRRPRIALRSFGLVELLRRHIAFGCEWAKSFDGYSSPPTGHRIFHFHGSEISFSHG